MKKESLLIQDNDPVYVAKELSDIIHILIRKMSLEAQQKAYPNLREKITNLNALDMSNKKPLGGAAIGNSISLVKNILNGKDPYFIKLVIDELKKELI